MSVHVKVSDGIGTKYKRCMKTTAKGRCDADEILSYIERVGESLGFSIQNKRVGCRIILVLYWFSDPEFGKQAIR